MIDKQIIDEMIEKIGFDVQQCGYLKIIKDALNYPEIGGTFTAFECNLYSRDCDFIERCRYKQLLRKEQECDELNTTITNLENIRDEFSMKLDQLKAQLLDQEAETLKAGGIIHILEQALNEIKEIAEKQVKRAPDGETFARPEIKQIIQKISECEVKNE